jgi:hypothetical protein
MPYELVTGAGFVSRWCHILCLGNYASKSRPASPAQFERLARARGYSPATKATEVTDWLKADYGLGHGHAMAVVKLLKERGVLK